MRVFIAALLLLSPAGCKPPPPVAPTTPPIPIDCPEPPPAMTPAEAQQELARYARELRANQMVRLEGVDKPCFATLHSPGLALVEAVLASPNKAQRLEPAWLQRHLLSQYVELNVQKNEGTAHLKGLDGDTRDVVLSDDKGRKRSALYMTKRSDSQGWSYRFYFDPLVTIVPERERVIMTFQLPIGSRVGVARWRLSRRALWGMDSLPVLYQMARLRELRLARWALLEGRRDEARGLLEDLLVCAPDLTSARQLLRAIEAEPRRPASREGVPVRSGQPAGGSELGHDPLRDLSLRAALLARLTPLAPSGRVRQAQEALKRGASGLAQKDLGWRLPPAVIDFDRALASLLAEALDGRSPLRPSEDASRLMVLEGAVPLSDQEVRAELERRVLLANYNLVPRWVRGPGGQRSRLLELQPVLTAEGSGTAGYKVHARLHRRLGWGWIHPGVPAHRYRVTYVDVSASYWQGQVRGISTIEALKPVARRLVEREIQSPDEQAAALAMAGWVQLKGEGAVGDLLPLLKLTDGGDPGRSAMLLRALAPLRDPKVLAAIQQGARSPRPELRAGAMLALGARLEGRQLLRNGLVDPDPSVVAAALEGLLRAGDGEGLKRARAWLLSGSPDQRKRVLSLAAAGRVRVSSLGRETLTRVYNSAPGLRAAIIKAARGKAFEKLFRRALSGEVVEQRRAAALKLAQLDRPPEALLDKATRDKDREVQLAAQIGLAKLGRTDSLLALGAGARGACAERRIVVPFLCRSMDARSRGRLLLDALQSDCSALWPTIWELVVRHQPRDLSLLRAAISSTSPRIRIQGALTALGLRSGAVLGIPP